MESKMDDIMPELLQTVNAALRAASSIITESDAEATRAAVQTCRRLCRRSQVTTTPRPSANCAMCVATAMHTSPAALIADSFVGRLPPTGVVAVYNYNGLGPVVRTAAGVIVCTGMVCTSAELEAATLAAFAHGHPPPGITYTSGDAAALSVARSYAADAVEEAEHILRDALDAKERRARELRDELDAKERRARELRDELDAKERRARELRDELDVKARCLDAQPAASLGALAHTSQQAFVYGGMVIRGNNIDMSRWPQRSKRVI